MRRFLLLALIVLVLPFVLWFDQNYRIRVRSIALHGDVASPVRLVHISDLHGMCWDDSNAALIQLIAAQAPDAICVTGDMYSRGSASGRRIAEALMSQLCAIAPVFFVPGEHDREPGYLRALTEAGVIIPGQQAFALREDLHFYGCSRAWFDAHSDYSQQYEVIDAVYSVLLCHIPVPEKFADAGFDLILSGDTHGGIVRLPLLGALYDGRTWLPELRGDAYLHGFYSASGMSLAVTAGLGGIPLRLGVPPEIQVIDILPASGSEHLP